MTVTTPCPALRLAPRAVTRPRLHQLRGFQQLVRLAAARALPQRLDKPEPLVPGQPVTLESSCRHPPRLSGAGTS